MTDRKPPIRAAAVCLLPLLALPSGLPGVACLAALQRPVPAGGLGLSAAQLWAIAAGANLRFEDTRFDRLVLGGTAAQTQAMLGQQWGVTGPAGAEPLLDALASTGHTAVLRGILSQVSTLSPSAFEEWLALQRPDLRPSAHFAYEHRTEFKHGQLLGWDLARLINVARAEYKVGWIDEATAWRHIMAAAHRLQREYSSWQELSDNYLLGRRFWGGSGESQARFEDRARWLTTDPSSPWRRLVWNTPLD